jgi:naphthalene 1,2-dioxygenase ferredoxin component
MSENWIDVVAVGAIPEGDVTAVSVGGKEIALYEVEGEIFATDNLCTHGAARMSDGFLEGKEIECPLHQGKFDVCTGKALCAPLTENIRVYPVRIENKRVLLNMSEA